MNIKIIVCVSLPLLIASCATYEQTPPKTQTEFSPGSDDDCRAACGNGRALKCVFAEPTPDGAACEAVCHNTETSGYVSMNPSCLAKAKSCEAADACADE